MVQADGKFKQRYATGATAFQSSPRVVDYQNQSTLDKLIAYQRWTGYYTGLTLNRWFASALQAMKVPPSEFERGGAKGYAHPYIDPSHTKFYVPQVLPSASEVLPLLKA